MGDGRPEAPADTGSMGQPAEIEDIESLSDDDLMALLGRLDREEHLVSMQRRRLHERIDGAGPRMNAGAFADLRHQERLASDRRLQLHRRIIELRIERARRISRSQLRAVE